MRQSILRLNNNQGSDDRKLDHLTSKRQSPKGIFFMKEKKSRTYVVRVLDLKYQSEFKYFAFNFIYYKVVAQHEEQAITKANSLYMKGERGEFK